MDQDNNLCKSVSIDLGTHEKLKVYSALNHISIKETIKRLILKEVENRRKD